MSGFRLLRTAFLLCLLNFLLTPVRTVAQDTLRFFEIIEYDSVALYFNENFSFTEKDCYDYVRHVRINGNGDFNGYFEDESIDKILLGKGVYYNGIKHGYFEIFHPNGKIFSRGYYENNRPVGIWEYFYSSGLPERTLEITDSAVLLIKHVSETGTVRIQNGNGKFIGSVSGSFYNSYIPVMGNVVNGKPEGKWSIPSANGAPLYTETFNNGMLIKTSTISKSKMKSVKVQPILNSFFLSNYLPVLEGFDQLSCSESQKYFFNRYQDLRAFNADLRKRINYLIETDVRNRQDENYEVGSNLMIIAFSVNELGKAYDVELVSDWGHRFFDLTKNAIAKTVFSPNYPTMYFQMKLSYSGNRKYRYTLRFSKHELEK